MKSAGNFSPYKISHNACGASLSHILQCWLLCKYLRLNKILVNIFFRAYVNDEIERKIKFLKWTEKKLIGKILYARFLCSYCLTPLKHHLMCSPWFMIDLKISHFISIWFFHIAALKTQPYDLLRWSAAYFRCLSMDVLPPVKPRYEQEIALGCLTKGYLKVLLSQVWMPSCMNMCKTTTIRQKAFSVLLKI